MILRQWFPTRGPTRADHASQPNPNAPPPKTQFVFYHANPTVPLNQPKLQKTRTKFSNFATAHEPLALFSTRLSSSSPVSSLNWIVCPCPVYPA